MTSLDPGSPISTGLQLVRSLWAAIQARHWQAARRLLHPQMQTRWLASGERFDSADAFIEANARYPEGWTIHLLELTSLSDGRVLSLVRVDHGAQTFFATSWWLLQDGRVVAVEEIWATAEAAPAWRDTLPGRTLFDPRDDARARAP